LLNFSSLLGNILAATIRLITGAFVMDGGVFRMGFLGSWLFSSFAVGDF